MWRSVSLRKIAGSMLVVTFMLPFSVEGADPTSCNGEVSVQVDLNQCAADRLQQADDELNRIYQAILKQYSEDRVFLEKFRKAQRAWLLFRDAELEAKFPENDKQSYYGSVYPMCAARFLAQRTQERIKQLQEWLEGAEEGDLCAGSLRIQSKQ